MTNDRRSVLFDGDNVYIKRDFPKNLIEAAIHALTVLHEGDMFLAGGCLLPHTTRDYDVIVWNDKRSDSALRSFWKANADSLGFKIVADYLADDPNPLSSESSETGDGSAKYIITLERKVNPTEGTDRVDIIYMADWVSTEYHYLADFMADYFPLSIQEIAINLRTGDRIGNPSLDVIQIKHESKCTEKYKEYYPDATFISYLEDEIIPI